MWFPSHENSGLTIIQSHHAQRTCRSSMYLPSMLFRFNGRLLSPCGFPREVSRCSEGLLLSTFPVSGRNSVCTDTARFEKPIECWPFPTDFSQCRMTASIWAKPVTRLVEIRSLWTIVDAFKDEVNHFLHDFIAGRGDSEFSHFSITFRNIDGPDRFELKLFRLHFSDEGVNHLSGNAIDGLPV
jgi:hypothetical protein